MRSFNRREKGKVGDGGGSSHRATGKGWELGKSSRMCYYRSWDLCSGCFISIVPEFSGTIGFLFPLLTLSTCAHRKQRKGFSSFHT